MLMLTTFLRSARGREAASWRLTSICVMIVLVAGRHSKKRSKLPNSRVELRCGHSDGLVLM